MHIDFETVQARHRRRQTHPTHDCPDRQVVADDIQYLIDKLTAARTAVDRLTENDEDLRASAEIWCRLYDAALTRAAEAEAAVANALPNVSPQAQILYDALDRVADLTMTLGGVIRDCAACARGKDTPSLSSMASEACARCAKALQALAPPSR